MLAGVAVYLDNLWWQPTRSNGIAFSHQVHVGERQIDCGYCHRGARGSDYAGVPSVSDCAGCHAIIKEYKGPQTALKPSFDAELKKLQQHLKDKTPISWAKYYDLSEHVKFSHQAHVAKGVDCAACHGDVAKMNEIRLVNQPGMGWCISCHKEKKAPLDCSVCHF